MLTVNEELKKLLGDEVAKALEEALKDTNAVLEVKENFIPKFRFDEVSNQAKELKANNAKLAADLESAVKNSKNSEELQATINKLQEDNKLAQEKYESDLLARERDYLISDALRGAGARNPKAARALLNIDDVKVIDGKLDGLEKQLEALKTSDAYLFEINNQQKDDQTKKDKFGNPIQESNGGTTAEEAEALAAKYGFGNPETKN